MAKLCTQGRRVTWNALCARRGSCACRPGPCGGAVPLDLGSDSDNMLTIELVIIELCRGEGVWPWGARSDYFQRKDR